MDAFSTCFDFVRVAVNHRHVIEEEENRWKIPEHIAPYIRIPTDIYIFLHVTLFIKHVETQLQRKTLIL